MRDIFGRRHRFWSGTALSRTVDVSPLALRRQQLSGVVGCSSGPTQVVICHFFNSFMLFLLHLLITLLSLWISGISKSVHFFFAQSLTIRGFADSPFVAIGFIGRVAGRKVLQERDCATTGLDATKRVHPGLGSWTGA